MGGGRCGAVGYAWDFESISCEFGSHAGRLCHSVVEVASLRPPGHLYVLCNCNQTRAVVCVALCRVIVMNNVLLKICCHLLIANVKMYLYLDVLRFCSCYM